MAPHPPEASRGTFSQHAKRQSRRLKAGQQALAGLTLGSLPVSASDTPETGRSTQRTGEVEELGGGTLPLDPWAHQGMEISDRPTTHDPNISDKVMYLQMAFKQRPLRDGGGKPSLGRLAPWARPLSKAAALGAKICVLTSPWGDKLQEPLSLGDGSHPFRISVDKRHSVALNIQDPDQFCRDLEQGVPLGVTDPPLTSPGIWPRKKELKGEEPELQELPHPTGRPRRITSASSSGAHFWRAPSVRRRQHCDVAATARTFVPAPWRASMRGTRSARSTMARWEGPMTPSGTRRWRGRRLRRCWMGSKLSIGYTPLSGCLWPQGGDRQTSTWGLAMAGAGHQVGAAQGGRHQGPPESEGPPEGLAVPGGLTGGRMVGEQGRHIWHGQCPILLGTPGSPSAQGPLRAFPSSGLELRLRRRLPVAASKRGGSELGGGAAGHTPGIGHPT